MRADRRLYGQFAGPDKIPIRCARKSSNPVSLAHCLNRREKVGTNRRPAGDETRNKSTNGKRGAARRDVFIREGGGGGRAGGSGGEGGLDIGRIGMIFRITVYNCLRIEPRAGIK